MREARRGGRQDTVRWYQSLAGQRDDPVLRGPLARSFDLGGLRPFNTAHLVPLATELGVDVGGYNTHTIAMQIPISQPSRGPNGRMIIASMPAPVVRKIRRTLNGDGTVKNNDGWVQVSRPNLLVNEVIIPLVKGLWNSQDPKRRAVPVELHHP